MKNNLYQFYQKYKFYIFPIVVILSGLFLIVFVIYPQTIELITGVRTSSDLANKSAFLETKVSALESLDTEDLSKKVASVLSSYPGERDFANTLNLLTSLVANSGFSVTSVSLNPSGNKLGNSDSFEVKLEIKGTRVLLGNLISNIEGSHRLMRINRIEVSQGSKASGSLDVSLSIGVLFSALPKTFGTVDSPIPELSQKDEELLATVAKMTREVTTLSTSVLPSSPRGKSNPFE